MQRGVEQTTSKDDNWMSPDGRGNGESGNHEGKKFQKKGLSNREEGQKAVRGKEGKKERGCLFPDLGGADVKKKNKDMGVLLGRHLDRAAFVGWEEVKGYQLTKDVPLVIQATVAFEVSRRVRDFTFINLLPQEGGGRVVQIK